jgi:hypothetical protein
VTTAIVSAVSVVIAALAALIVDWMKSDSRLKTTSTVLDEAAKELQFLESWCKIHAAIEALPEGEPKAEAHKYATEILSAVQTRIADARERRTVTTAGSEAMHIGFRVLGLLRLAAPRHPVVWIPQLAFYALLALSLRMAWVLGKIDGAVLVLMTLSILCWVSCWLLESRLAAAKPVRAQP